jgi:hypothetical protein
MIQKVLENIAEEFVDEFVKKWDDAETQKKIKERFLDPVINYVMDKMYPYFLVCATVVFLLLSLLIMIFYILLRR